MNESKKIEALFKKHRIKYTVIHWTKNGVKFIMQPTEEDLKLVSFKGDFNFCVNNNEPLNNEVKRQVNYWIK